MGRTRREKGDGQASLFEIGLESDAAVPTIPRTLSARTRVSVIDIDDVAPTVQAGNASIGDARQNVILASGKRDDGEKPPYRIPTMSEINTREKNGLVVVSTFSGCGGSCLGFKMAGYEVLWANEFVEAARETYRANHPTVILDSSDIRTVTGATILAAVGAREIDVLEGSPPCASFSTAGKGSRGWGEIRKYSDTKQRTDDLFEQFARLVDELRPRAFVAENVAGLVRGVAKGHFKQYLQAFRSMPYRVEARLLDAQYLGVPQRRVRVIFVGVRDDVGRPAWPKKLPYRYSIRDAIPWIRDATTRAHGWTSSGDMSADLVAPTVPSRPSKGSYDGSSVSHEQLYQVEPESGLSRSVGSEWDAIEPGSQSDKYLNLIRPDVDGPCPTVTQLGGTSAASVVHPFERRKFSIAELRRICGFPDDFILTGTYAQQWERLGRAVPPPMMRAVAEALIPVLAR